MIKHITEQAESCTSFSAKFLAACFKGSSQQTGAIYEELAETLIKKLGHLSDELNSRDIEEILYGLSGRYPGNYRKTIEQLNKVIRDKKIQFSALEIAQIFQSTSLHSSEAIAPLYETLLDKLDKEASGRVGLKELSKIFLGLKYIEADTFKTFIQKLEPFLEKLRKEDLRNTDQIAMLISGIVDQNIEGHESSFKFLLENLNSNNFNLANVTLLVQGLRGKNKDLILPTVVKIAQYLSNLDFEQIAKDDIVGLTGLFRALNLFTFKQPVCKNYLGDIIKSLNFLNNAPYNQFTDRSIQSRAESIATPLVEEYFKTLEVQHNKYIDGIEMDFYIPDKKLNIEIDSGFHSRKIDRDAYRDHYLETIHGIDTIRINIDIRQETETLKRKQERYEEFIQKQVCEALKGQIS